MPEAIKSPPPAAAKLVDAPAPKTAAAATPVTAAKPTSAPKAEVAAKPAPADKPASAPQPALAAKVAPAEAAKRKRGRPLGAKSKPKPVAAKPAPVKAAPAVAKAAAKPVPSLAPSIAKTVTKLVAPLPVATPSQGSKTMNDTIATMQDTAKKFTGEASARAKGAYEKGLKLTEEFTEFQKGNVEAVVETTKLAAKAAETLSQEAADYARKSFESGTAAFKGFASAKSPTELFKLQSDYVKSYFDSMVAESSKVTEAWLKTAGEIAQPLSNRMSLAVDKVKVAAAF